MRVGPARAALYLLHVAGLHTRGWHLSYYQVTIVNRYGGHLLPRVSILDGGQELAHARRSL